MRCELCNRVSHKRKRCAHCDKMICGYCHYGEHAFDFEPLVVRRRREPVCASEDGEGVDPETVTSLVRNMSGSPENRILHVRSGENGEAL